jgi:putative transposase
MKVQRVERHQINKNNPLWSEFDDLCFKAKNLYNYTNYIQRQRFINGDKIYKCNDLDKMINQSEPYKEFGSQSSQRLLKLLEKN